MRAVDLFAGAGGFTTGATAAGVDVLLALNHWAAAVDIHARNHGGVTHWTQDAQEADWRLVPDHDLLLASPACQGHSQAGQPGRWQSGVLRRQQADRNTAWAVIACAETKRPRTILVENVADFLRWPLFGGWTRCLELLGYVVRTHVFDVADFGLPQNRVRAIVTARQGEALDLASPGLEWRGFGPCVDWAAGEWAAVAGKTAGVRRRIQRGRDRGLGRRFLTHYVTGHPGRSLSRPIGCVTTKAQWAVVDGDRTRMLSTAELRRAMGFPADYVLPTGKTLALRMLGNAIPPGFAQELVAQAVAA